MMFNLIMNHKKAKDIVKEKGFDGFMGYFEKEYNYNFYSCSTYWENDPNYICKLKGAKGDIIVGWEGVHSVGRRS